MLGALLGAVYGNYLYSQKAFPFPGVPVNGQSDVDIEEAEVVAAYKEKTGSKPDTTTDKEDG